MEIDTTRLKVEDWVSLAGSLVLIGSVFLSWYTLSGNRVSGFDSTRLTWILLVVGILVLLVEVALALGVVFPRSEGFVLVSGGVIVGVLVIVRIFVRQAGLRTDYGIYIALTASVVLVAVGAVKLIRSYYL